MDKYYAQEKRVFDINKVTVVGNPTITSGGVASGFSAGNYVYVPIILTSNNKIKITDKFAYTSEYIAGSGKQIYVAGNQQFRIIVQPTRFVIYIADGASGIAFDIKNSEFTIAINDTVYYELIIDNSTQHSLKIWKNGQLYVNKTSTVVADFDKTNFYVGASNWGDFALYSSIDLKQFSITVDGKEVYSPTKPVYALERRKPKVWNKGQFTIVGNPSISDDGIASGFSGTDGNKSYIQINTNLPIISGQNKMFRFCMEYKHKNVGVSQPLFWFYSETNPNYRFMYLSANSKNGITTALWDLGWIETQNVLKDGKSYKIEYITDLVSYYQVYIDGNCFINKTVVKENLNLVLGNIKIGAMGDTTSYNASLINLKQFKIYTDNNLVFDGGAETYVYDPSKFTVVGSPTISEYGVASGFSTSDYITEDIYIDFSKAWNAQGTFTTGDVISAQNIVSLEGGLAPLVYLVIAGSKFLSFRFTLDGVKRTIDTTFMLLQKTKYEYIIGWDRTNYYLKIRISGETWESFSTFNSKMLDTASSNYILFGTTNAFPLLGSIDLPSFSITVDGKEVFTGAKEKFYAMRGM